MIHGFTEITPSGEPLKFRHVSNSYDVMKPRLLKSRDWQFDTRSKQCCQFGDFVAKFSYFLIVAATFIDFLRQGVILAIFK